jgi:hypothetical protein
MAALPSEINAAVYAGKFKFFAPGVVIVGDKPGGVEGGCIVRLVYQGPMEKFPHENAAGYEQLQKMSSENSLLLPESLRACNLHGEDVLQAFDRLSLCEQTDLSQMLMNLSPTFRKSFMVKVIFGKENVGGLMRDIYYKPNAKSTFRKHLTSRTREKVNEEVISEYVSLNVARVLNPRIFPMSFIGTVDENRSFIGTEIGGSGEDGVTFKMVGECSKEEIRKLGLEEIATAYATTAFLLGDRDANGDPNVGVLTASDGTVSPFYFDLGHMDPNKFVIDPRTLLPANVSDSSLGFRLGSILKDGTILSQGGRETALARVCSMRGEILDKVHSMRSQVGGDPSLIRIVDKIEADLAKRLSYLDGLLRKNIARRENEANYDPFHMPPMPTAM